MGNTNPILRPFTPRKPDLKRRYHLGALAAALRLPVIEGDDIRRFAIIHHLRELNRLDIRIPSSNENLELAAIAMLRSFGMDAPINPGNE